LQQTQRKQENASLYFNEQCRTKDVLDVGYEFTRITGNRCIHICITSRPIIAIAGTVKSHGTSLNIATSKGREHNKIKVAATISCI
jgi:hypothetical protein